MTALLVIKDPCTMVIQHHNKKIVLYFFLLHFVALYTLPFYITLTNLIHLYIITEIFNIIIYYSPEIFLKACVLSTLLHIPGVWNCKWVNKHIRIPLWWLQMENKKIWILSIQVYLINVTNFQPPIYQPGDKSHYPVEV